MMLLQCCALLCLIAPILAAKYSFSPSLKPLPTRNTFGKSTTTLKQVNADAQATGYIVYDEFLSSSTCSGAPEVYRGIGTGVCYAGHDANGTMTGSAIYTFTKSSGNMIFFDMTTFSSVDCSGSGVVSHEGGYLTCFADDSNTVGFRISYTTATEPWSSFGSGLVTQFFDSGDHCAATTPMSGKRAY